MTHAERGLREHFVHGNRSCDAEWAEVESAGESGERARTEAAWKRFEAKTGSTSGGPTFAMRAEHEQMRALLARMRAAIDRGDVRELLDQGDTLLLLIQQHNQKEEGMLYPMAERALHARWPEIREQLGKR